MALQKRRAGATSSVRGIFALLCVALVSFVKASPISCSSVCTITSNVLEACTGDILDGDELDCSSPTIDEITPGAFSHFGTANFPSSPTGPSQFVEISIILSGQSGLHTIRNGTFAGLHPLLIIKSISLQSSSVTHIEEGAFQSLNADARLAPFTSEVYTRESPEISLELTFTHDSETPWTAGDHAFADMWFGHGGSLTLPSGVQHIGRGAFRGSGLPGLALDGASLQNVSEDCFRDVIWLFPDTSGFPLNVQFTNLFVNTGGGDILPGAFAGSIVKEFEAGVPADFKFTGHLLRIHSHAFDSFHGSSQSSVSVDVAAATLPSTVRTVVEPFAFTNVRIGGLTVGAAFTEQVHSHWDFKNQSLACMSVLDFVAGGIPACAGLTWYPYSPVRRELEFTGSNDGGIMGGSFNLGRNLDYSVIPTSASSLTTASMSGFPFYPEAHFNSIDVGVVNDSSIAADMLSGLNVSPLNSGTPCVLRKANFIPDWASGSGIAEVLSAPLRIDSYAFRGSQLACALLVRLQQTSASQPWTIDVQPHAFVNNGYFFQAIQLQGVLQLHAHSFAGLQVSGRFALEHSSLSPSVDTADPATFLVDDIFQDTTATQLLVSVHTKQAYAVPPFFLRGLQAETMRLYLSNTEHVDGVHGSLAIDSYDQPNAQLFVQGDFSFVAPPGTSTGMTAAPGAAYLRNVRVANLVLSFPTIPEASVEPGSFASIFVNTELYLRHVSDQLTGGSKRLLQPVQQQTASCINIAAFVPVNTKPLLESIANRIQQARLEFVNFYAFPDFGISTDVPSEGDQSSGSLVVPACSCPRGTISQIFSSARFCVDCPAGLFCTGTDVEACPAGTFNERTGATSAANCTQCAPGTYSEVQGATSRACAQCPAGTFLNATGGSSPDQCTPCPAGTYASFTGSPTCTPCPQGTYSDATGTRQCIACPLDTYGIREGGSSLATACRACPSGSGTFSVGTGSPAGCIGSTQLASIQGPVAGAPTCAAGESNAVDGTCVPCPLGHACPSGIALPCPAGAYNNRRGIASLDACEQCPAGSFNPIEGQTSVACVPCPSGTASSAAGAVDSAACVDCAPGYASLLPGQSSCSACSIGTYAAGSGSRQCTSCPANTFGSRQAATSAGGGCAACPPGTDTAGLTGATSSAACRAVAAAPPATCGPNQVRDSEDASVCVDVVCGAGTVLQGTVCVGCAAGTFGDPGDAAVGCTACPPGQVCPGGTFSAIVTPERVSTSSAQLQESAVQAQETVPAQSESQGSAGGVDVNVLIFGSTVLLAVLLPVLLLVMSSLCSKRTRDVLESADTFTTDHDYSDGRAIVKKGTVLGGACTVCMSIIIIGFIAASAVQYATRNTLVSTRFDPAGTAITSTGAVKSDWVMDVAAMVEGVATSGDCPQPSGVLRFEGGKAGAGAGGVNGDWRVAAAARVSSAQPGPSLAPSSICTYRAECTGCALESTLRVRVRLPSTAQSTSWSLRSRRATSGDTEGLPVYSLVKGAAGATSTQRLRSSAWTLSATREVLQDSRSGGDDVYGYLLALVDQSIVYLDGSTAVSGFVPAATPVQLSIDVQVAPAASVIAVSALQTPLGLIAALGGLVGAIIGIFRFVYGESEQYVQGALVAVGWLRRQDQWAESEEGGDVLKPLPGKGAGFMYTQSGVGTAGKGAVAKHIQVGARSGPRVGGGSMSSTVLAAPPADANGRTVLDVDDAEAAYGGVHANPVSLGVSDSQSVMTDDRGSAWSS